MEGQPTPKSRDASRFFAENLVSEDISENFKDTLREQVHQRYLNFYKEKEMSFFQKLFAIKGFTIAMTAIIGISIIGIASGAVLYYKEQDKSNGAATNSQSEEDLDTQKGKIIVSGTVKPKTTENKIVVEPKEEKKEEVKQTQQQEPAPVTGSISLSGSADATGINLHWDVSNADVSNGFKIVKGVNPNPTYGVDGAIYVGASSRDYHIDVKNGQTYHFRVCRYTGSGCDTYSNNVSVTAPTAPAPVSNVSSITLTDSGNGAVNWSVDGTAAFGFKLVWSVSSNPTYPPQAGGSAAYYEANKFSGAINYSPLDPGTYFVRVCEYEENGTCGVYSNEISVVIP